MKKLIYILILFTFLLGIYPVKGEEISNKTIKRVISIVYDDSGSMNNQNEHWAYASYSTQNLISLMNSQDELSVTKMSSPMTNITFSLSDNEIRKNDIKEIENWNASAGTPFMAVDTAVNWIKNKKKDYDDSQNIEFWLVVITDGAFGSGYPSNMEKYLEDVKKTMGSSKYESILVAIGNEVPKNLKTDWTRVTGNHLITAQNGNDIVTAMSNVSKLILGQSGENEGISIKYGSSKKEVIFESYLPLKKFIIFQQEQNIDVKEIIGNEVNIDILSNFNTKNPGKENIISNIIHCEPTEDNYINVGKTIIKFEDEVDIASDKFNILVEPAISLNLTVLDDNGKEIKALNSISIEKDALIEFAGTVVSSIDGEEINLRNWEKDLSSELIINNQKIEMKYDSKENKFYASYKMTEEDVYTYAVVTLPGYFRAKSDVNSIYIKDKIEDIKSNISNNVINVPYKYANEFEEVALFTYEVTGAKLDDICNFTFSNIPKGITISVNGVYVDKNGKLSVKIKNDVPADVKIYRNKDYKETKEQVISLEVTNSKYELEWKEDSIRDIIVKPVKRKLTIEKNEIKENNQININKFDKNLIYILSILSDNEYLDKEELETLTLEINQIKGISFETEVIEYEGRYALKLTCIRDLPKLFVKTGNINEDILFKTIYGETTAKEKISFEIKDSILKYVLPLLLVIFIIILIGHLPGIKKRLSKKFYIETNGEMQSIHIKLVTRLIPYIKEKGVGSDLTLIATSNKNKVIVVNDFIDCRKITINGDDIDTATNKIDLYVNEELKVISDNNETIYIYKNAKTENSFIEEFDSYNINDDDEFIV